MIQLARLGAVVAAPLLALGLCAPADAATYTHTDKTGDVKAEQCPPGATADPCPYVVDPTIKEGDILSATVRHKARKVVMTMHLRDITVGKPAQIEARLATNEGVRRWVEVFIAPDGSTRARMYNGRWEQVSCSIGRTISFANNVTEIRIPRRCLSAPRWVRAGQNYWWIAQTPPGEDYVAWRGDDSLSGQPNDAPTLSPRIRRG